jgi:hypothetical protein
MPVKIRIKLGDVEIDFEGEEAYFKEEVPIFLSDLSKLLKDTIPAKISETPKTMTTTFQAKAHTPSIDEIKTTSTIAQKIKVKSGLDLILAAAIKFTLNDGKETFNRDEILKEMQTATAFYKSSFNNNATKYLKNLVRSGKLRQNATHIFALSPETKIELREKLGLE